MSAFRDDFERQAHDVICIIKFGRTGGTASAHDVRAVADYLRGGPYRPKIIIPKIAVPRVIIPKRAS